MRVMIFPSDRGGCGMYRMYWPGKALYDQGFDVKVSYNRPQMLQQGVKVVGLAVPIDADIVVFQRPARLQYVEAFKYFQSIGIKVVVDCDDNLSKIHPLNAAYKPYQEPNGMHFKYAEAACHLADMVITTTQELADFYGNPNSVVIPNFIPEANLSIERIPNELVTVGWAGLMGTHPQDPQVTHGAINQAIAATRGKSRFLALGDHKALSAFAIRDREPNGSRPGVNIEQYPNLLSILDIGVVPLEDTEFNRAKSWLKALEYAAVGVAPIATPTPDNQRIIDAGACLSAASPKEWLEGVQHLIEDESARVALQTRARAFAAENTIEGNAHLWWEAWSNLA